MWNGALVLVDGRQTNQNEETASNIPLPVLTVAGEKALQTIVSQMLVAMKSEIPEPRPYPFCSNSSNNNTIRPATNNWKIQQVEIRAQPVKTVEISFNQQWIIKQSFWIQQANEKLLDQVTTMILRAMMQCPWQMRSSFSFQNKRDVFCPPNSSTWRKLTRAAWELLHQPFLLH